MPVVAALRENLYPERGVGSRRILVWHDTVTELRLEFTHLLHSHAPNGCKVTLACAQVETNTFECSNVLSCHRI